MEVDDADVPLVRIDAEMERLCNQVGVAVAQVARALTFDAKGRPNLSNVSDSWNIRNVTYEFRVRPIAGKPEMLLVQSEKADFVLPAGRYVLVLKEQGYDFTVAGQVTDLAHCLERTDAANGSFYSECLKF